MLEFCAVRDIDRIQILETHPLILIISFQTA